MAKNKTEIHVTTVFDGELDATDVFVSLISQKYGKTNSKEYLAKKKDLKYNEDEVQKSQIPSGLCALAKYRDYYNRNQTDDFPNLFWQGNKMAAQLFFLQGSGRFHKGLFRPHTSERFRGQRKRLLRL